MSWPPQGTKEFGMAVELVTDAAVPTEDEMAAARKMVAFNFKMTREAHPDWGLTYYEFVSGPAVQVWEYGECPQCHGDGSWEQHGQNGFEEMYSCPQCDGLGMVPTRLADPPRWKHPFGWYTLAPGGALEAK